MKPFYLTLFSLVYILLNSQNQQIEVKSLHLSDPSQNILYIGIENKIKVLHHQISSIKYDNQEAKFDRNFPGVFTIRVSKVGSTKLYFYNHDYLIFSLPYESKRVPEPKITLAGVAADSISIKTIEGFPLIKIDLQNSNLLHNFRIVSYEIAIYDSYGLEVYKEKNTSEYFSKSLLAVMSGLLPNSRIAIKNIKMEMGDGSIRAIPDLFYRITS